MKNYLRVKEGAEDCCQALDAIHDMLVDTLTQAKALQSSVETMQWKGENRDHFVMILDLIIQYHTDLTKAGNAFLHSFIEIHENILDYDAISKVISLERIT